MLQINLLQTPTYYFWLLYDYFIFRLVGVNIYVAAENTWQGIITGNWPYDNIPLKFEGKLKKNHDYAVIKIKEHEWNYLKGMDSFEKCTSQYDEDFNYHYPNCQSFFHPNTFKHKTR